MAKAWRGGEMPAPADDGGVGKPLARYGALDQALGTRPYVADMQREGLLHGALVLSAHARARVVRIDTSKAAALGRSARRRHGRGRARRALVRPPVRRLARLRGRGRGGALRRRRPRRGGGRRRAHGARGGGAGRGRVRAAATASSIPRRPSLPDAPQVNPKHPNLLSRSVIRRGDAAAALAASAHVVSGTWRTQRIEHLFLEPEAALAEPLPDGRLALYTQGQGVFDDRRQVAGFLGVPEERVHVELVPSGGAFGGKEDMSVQAQTALLARVTGRPVKLVLDPRGVRPDPPEAPPHPARLHGRLRRRGAAHGGRGAARRRLGRLRLGRRQGARARGRPRLRPVPRAGGGRRGAGRLHEQPAVRGHARLRRAPGGLRHRGLPRPPREEGRPRRLGDPQPQRRGRRRHRHHRPGAREVGGPPQDARRGEGRLLRGAPRREGRRDRLRPQEQRHRQRRRRVGQVPAGRGDRRDGLALQRLHGDGPGAADRARAVRGRGHGPARLRLPPEGGLDLRPRLRPDDRLTGDALRRPRGHERGAEAAGRPRRGPTPRRPHRPRLRGGRGDRRHHGSRRRRRRGSRRTRPTASRPRS